MRAANCDPRPAASDTRTLRCTLEASVGQPGRETLALIGHLSVGRVRPPTGIDIATVRFRKPSFLRSLLLLCLLVIGPLQAQVAYACAMMDTVVHDCCCDDSASETDHLRVDLGIPAEGERMPCCEVSVQVTVDQETRPQTPAFKPPDARPDLDPAPALVVTFDHPFLLSQRPTSYAHDIGLRLPEGGSDTWLLTRRLRI